MIRLALILLLSTAGAAEAGPLGAAIAGVVGAVKTFAASSVIGGFLVRTAVSLGLSLLARALQPKPKAPRQPGIQTEVTTTGGTESQAFVLGRYATGGHLVAPPYSHGTAGGTPNAYLTYIVEVSDIPGVSLARVIVNDGYTDLGETAHPDYGFPLLAFRDGSTDYAWVKFHDGTQTTADAMLLDRYSGHPDRPWTAQHIGTGTAYAIFTFRYNREVFNGLPSVRVELDGIPLYDPRADTTVGGSGAQRWDDPATWQPTDNPAVMIYNILRGITLPDGRIWGGDAEAEALPLSNWFAAMNVCDTDMDGRPQFRAGFEVRVADDDGAGVIEDLLAACTGQIAEYGGVWRIRIGAPASPVWSLTDDDIIITDPQGFDAFPGLESTYNGIAATYPEPASLWQSREAPPIYNPAWEAEDGDRRLVASLSLPACPYVAQVGQVMEAYIKDQRRFRSHTMVLPPDASILEPLDAISWTSERNGYVTKVFEVVEITSRTDTLCQEVLLRERDPEDYSYDPVNDLPQPADQTGTTPPPPQPVESWAVTGTTITDGLAVGRRPALLLEWSGSAAEDADFVRYEVRLVATGAVIASGLADREAGRVLIAQGILPVTEYEARGRYVLDRPTEWSSWLSATTPDVRFGADDFDALADIFADQGLSAPEIVDSLPAIGNFEGRLAFLTTDGLLYRYTSGAWTAAVDGGQLIDGTITGGKIVANTITGGLLATAGIITSAAQIDNAIITGAKLVDATIDTAKIADAAIASAKIADAAITTAKIGDLQVETAKIKDLAVDTIKINNNAVTVLRAIQIPGTESISVATYETIGSLTFTPSDGVDLVLWFVTNASLSGAGADGNPNMRVRWRGSVVYQENGIGLKTRMSVITGGTGEGTMDIQIAYSTFTSGSANFDRTALIIGEFKR